MKLPREEILKIVPRKHSRSSIISNLLENKSIGTSLIANNKIVDYMLKHLTECDIKFKKDIYNNIYMDFNHKECSCIECYEIRLFNQGIKRALDYISKQNIDLEISVKEEL